MKPGKRRPLIVLAVAVLLAMGIATTELLGRLAQAQNWLLHTREVQLALTQARTLLSETESAQRSYLLAGDARLLEPYRVAGSALQETVHRVGWLTRDNPRQQARMPVLRDVSARRIQALTEVLQLEHTGAHEAALQRIRTGPALMPQARALLDEMQAEEDRLLQERLATVRRQEWVARAMLAALTTSGAMLLVGLHLAMARGERRLRDSEELMRSLVDNAPALVRLRAPDGRPRLENRPYHDLRQAHEADAVWLDTELVGLEAQALSSGAPVSRALAQPGPEGVRHLQGASFPVQGDDGRVLGVGSILTDVSALERARAELQQLTETLEEQVRQRTARLTEANAELEAFSYMVSHDLRAPLRAVQGFAQALAEDAGPLLDEETRGFIVRINNAAQRMDRLIEDLLAYGRLSRAEVSLTPVPLQAAVEEALQWLGSQLQASGAQVQVAPSMPAVAAHPAVLVQVLQNLLANAIKFVAPGVQPRARVSAQGREGGWVRVTVEDNGIGIAPEDQDRIFTPFERLHGAERYAGSGIGLATVKRGIERLGGRVGLVSQAGEGSSFWFELREAGPDAVPQCPGRQTPAATAGSLHP